MQTQMLESVVLGSRKRLAFEVCEDPVTVKRFQGLVTPPGSPVKKCKTKEVSTLGSPIRLHFGASSVYSRTKAALQRCADVSQQGTVNLGACLPTRGEQYDRIMAFLNSVVGSGHGDSLYITGPPGTGKTAQLDLVVREKFQTLVLEAPQLQQDYALRNTSFFTTKSGHHESVAIVSINCIAVNSAESIFAKIYHSCSGDSARTKVRNADDLQKFMQAHPQTTFIVILDEMDKLVTSTLQDANATKHIFDLFLMAKLPHLKFVLIGIANSLDMKDRFLSRLNLKHELMPQTVTFTPYTAEQMFEIVMQKLKSLDFDPIIQPIAIRFAAKKCSGNTGDLRKVFDILRSSIEVLELDSIKNRHTLNETTAKVTLAHVAKVFSTLHNNFSTKSRISKLNMQQRLVLCSLVHRERSDVFQTQTSLDEAYDYYSKLLNRKDSISPLKRDEFFEICNALETCGVVNIVQGKSSGKTKHIVKFIKANVDKKEFEDEISKLASLKTYL
ncbi:AAA family ATPase CDC6 [Lachancea thermotolerans CBS 6340]|uniref:Cell division control protein n=1 Tax=Lachancea thermotolerans (strain ATCC 56472 / CBS 6340 / NRRL Y-8284) TaxID=559295 RepID=C5DKD6_LACTC|nr:KLTH0F03784p [Lachancea thermotolerans CBS 6340]CAR23937.1 KLTH0F03784p [Lachancea thermotolerans CBS 6340]